MARPSRRSESADSGIQLPLGTTVAGAPLRPPRRSIGPRRQGLRQILSSTGSGVSVISKGWDSVRSGADDCTGDSTDGRVAGGASTPRRLGPRGRSLAFQPGDRLSVLAGLGGEGRLGSTRSGSRLRRPREVRPFRGRVAPRWPGSPLGAQGLADKPVYVFETGGTTGIPKSRIAVDDFRTDYELFSETLPDEHFPLGSNWLMLGPSGPRRLRLAVEHLAQHRGGICFMVDLDPRWVIKLIKKGWMDHLKAYQEHVIDQAVTVLSAGHDIKCLFSTPKLIEAWANRSRSGRVEHRRYGHHRDLRGWHGVHAPVEPIRAGGAARWGVHDADLRQHADGAGGESRRPVPLRDTRSPTTRLSLVRCCRSSIPMIRSS